MSAPCYTATPIGGGESKLMSEAEFRTAFVITSADLGDGHFRHMASTADRRIVNILQAPSSEVDELMISASTDGAELVIATSGRDRIAAGLNGKAVKPAVIKLTGHGKIAAGLTALARRADQ